MGVVRLYQGSTSQNRLYTVPSVAMRLEHGLYGRVKAATVRLTSGSVPIPVHSSK